MTENTNHETGGTFVDEDVVTEQSANTKYILIQAAAPNNDYDGQIWENTSSDPPLLKIYDTTNTAYMERRPIWYEVTAATVTEVPAASPTLDGTLVVQYSSGTGVTTLFVKTGVANLDWWRRTDA